MNNGLDIRPIIKCIHRIWYDEHSWIEDPRKTIELHEHLSVLFNYAEITSTLIENNPEEVTVDMFLEMHNIRREN